MKKNAIIAAHFIGPVLLGLRLFAGFHVFLDVLFLGYILAFPFMMKEQQTGMSAHQKMMLYLGEIAVMQWFGFLIRGAGHCLATGVLFTLLFVLEWKHSFVSKHWKI